MSNVGSSNSPQMNLIKEWGRGFEERNVDILAKSLHKDFRYVPYPQSLNQPEKTREEWLQHLSEVFSLWTESEHIQHSVIEAPGTVIYHFTQKTKTKLGIDMPYEAITISHIVPDENGDLVIKKIEEFIDSKTYLESMQAVAAALAK